MAGQAKTRIWGGASFTPASLSLSKKNKIRSASLVSPTCTVRTNWGLRDGFLRGRPEDFSIGRSASIPFTGEKRPTDETLPCLAYLCPTSGIPPGLLIAGASWLHLEEPDLSCNLAHSGAASGAPGGASGSATDPADLTSTPLIESEAAKDYALAEKAFVDAEALLDRAITDLFSLGDSRGLLTSAKGAWGPQCRGSL